MPKPVLNVFAITEEFHGAFQDRLNFANDTTNDREHQARATRAEGRLGDMGLNFSYLDAARDAALPDVIAGLEKLADVLDRMKNRLAFEPTYSDTNAKRDFMAAQSDPEIPKGMAWLRTHLKTEFPNGEHIVENLIDPDKGSKTYREGFKAWLEAKQADDRSRKARAYPEKMRAAAEERSAKSCADMDAKIAAMARERAQEIGVSDYDDVHMSEADASPFEAVYDPVDASLLPEAENPYDDPTSPIDDPSGGAAGEPGTGETGDHPGGKHGRRARA